MQTNFPNKCMTVRNVKSETKVLTEIESKDILKKAGIAVVETRLTTSRIEAVSISKNMGFPVALKIVSPDITHKTDAGGVRLGLETAAQAGKAYDEILANARQFFPKADIRGVSVQRMVPPGVEVVVGMTRDAQFGPLLMFGLGGIWVEILKDTSLRIIPVNRKDASDMIKEIKGYNLLTGFRGSKPLDLSKLEDLLLAVADFAESNPDVKELDLNPVIASSESIIAVDARVVLGNL
jgi:acetate---CoA ligase (ADP-forming) subunit beta